MNSSRLSTLRQNLGYQLHLKWDRLLWPNRCRYCRGRLDALDLRFILMCDACCKGRADLQR